MKCICCGEYFKPSSFSTSLECPDCEAVIPDFATDIGFEAELEILRNPSGKTAAVFYDNEDSI